MSADLSNMAKISLELVGYVRYAGAPISNGSRDAKL